jgi:hypothetical protein
MRGAMRKIVKLNYDRKVRYIFDKETEELQQLGEKVVDHFGKFINHSWVMDDVKRFHKTLRECGLSVSEFLATDWPKPEEKPKRTRKPRKSVATKTTKPRKTATKKAIKKNNDMPKKSKKVSKKS